MTSSCRFPDTTMVLSRDPVIVVFKWVTEMKYHENVNTKRNSDI